MMMGRGSIKMESRDYVAFTLFMDEIVWTDFFQGYTDEFTLEEYVEMWKETKMPSLKEEHFGDCTKMPVTCTRCETEEYYAEADQIIKAFEDYDNVKRKD